MGGLNLRCFCFSFVAFQFDSSAGQLLHFPHTITGMLRDRGFLVGLLDGLILKGGHVPVCVDYDCDDGTRLRVVCLRCHACVAEERLSRAFIIFSVFT